MLPVLTSPEPGSSNNVVEGNVIGLGSGGTALGNTNGVEFDAGASGNTIGGLTNTPGTGAGTSSPATPRTGSSSTATAGNNTLIDGNIIGLAADGTTARGNTDGVLIIGGLDAQIGGTDAHERNVISANANGIVLSTSGSDFNVLIEGNYIGTDVTGTLAEGNSVGISVGSCTGDRNRRNSGRRGTSSPATRPAFSSRVAATLSLGASITPPSRVT